MQQVSHVFNDIKRQNSQENSRQAYAGVEGDVCGFLVPRPLRVRRIESNDVQAAGLCAVAIERERHEEEKNSDKERKHPSQERAVHAAHESLLLCIRHIVRHQRVQAHAVKRGDVSAHGSCNSKRDECVFFGVVFAGRK